MQYLKQFFFSKQRKSDRFRFLHCLKVICSSTIVALWEIVCPSHPFTFEYIKYKPLKSLPSLLLIYIHQEGDLHQEMTILPMFLAACQAPWLTNSSLAHCQKPQGVLEQCRRPVRRQVATQQVQESTKKQKFCNSSQFPKTLERNPLKILDRRLTRTLYVTATTDQRKTVAMLRSCTQSVVIIETVQRRNVLSKSILSRPLVPHNHSSGSDVGLNLPRYLRKKQCLLTSQRVTLMISSKLCARAKFETSYEARN